MNFVCNRNIINDGMAYSPTCGQCKRLLHFRWDIQKRVHLPWPVPAFLECMTAAAVAVSKFDQRSIEPPPGLDGAQCFASCLDTPKYFSRSRQNLHRGPSEFLPPNSALSLCIFASSRNPTHRESYRCVHHSVKPLSNRPLFHLRSQPPV